MQLHFRSAKIFSRAFRLSAPARRRFKSQLPVFFTSLQQTQEKLFVFIFIDKFSTLRLQHVSRAFIFET